MLLNSKEKTDSFLLKQIDNTVFIDSIGSIHHYSVSSTIGEVVKTDYYIDVNSKLIRKIQQYFDPVKMPDMSKVEITYTLFDTNPQFSETEFSKENFVVKKNGKWFAMPMYKGYSVNVIE
jgi:hypothetical protein